MIYTKDKEITLVKKNLEIFENRISPRIVKKLLNKHLRIDQHWLFYSLCDPRIYPFLLPAIEIIKQVNKPKYLPKTIKKLMKANKSIDQRAVVAEIISVAYYFHKFSGSKEIAVEWERKVPNSTKVMDISLLGKSKPINIEVTAKDADANQNQHLELRYRVKVAIEQAIESLSTHSFSYRFSLAMRDVDGTTITDFNDIHIKDFVDFILQVRKHGEGEYMFEIDGKVLASVVVARLNKLKSEYAADMDMWTGFLNDERRIRNRIVDKARMQLPPNELNFVFIPNLGGFDEIDYQEAFWGKEQWHINKNDDIAGISRKSDGAIHVIASEHYSPVSGLIWSGYDYTKKKLLVNPIENVASDVIRIVG
ncbi:MAG: hypothetical protein ABH812_01555 [bacterium]